jgi:hypothetical protein
MHVCVCVYIYIYIYIHVCMYVCTHLRSFLQVATNSSSKNVAWGFTMGAFVCMSITFAFGTIMGLAARQFDLALSDTDIEKGLVAPALAVHLLGGAGASLFSVMVRAPFPVRPIDATHIAKSLSISSLLTLSFGRHMQPHVPTTHTSWSHYLRSSRTCTKFSNLSTWTVPCTQITSAPWRSLLSRLCWP